MGAEDLKKAPRCTATSKSTGKRCGMAAIRGGRVCIVHGGGSPAAKAMAERRIATLVDPALEVMFEMLMSKKTTPAVRFSIIKDILDRAGYKPVEKHEHTQLWNGDPSSLTDEQLKSMEAYFWSFVDPSRRDELQQKAIASEGPVIDAEFVRVPELPAAPNPPAGADASKEDGEEW